MVDTSLNNSGSAEHKWTSAALFRKPDLTHQEFSAAWLNHGQLVTPWFLASGVQEYIQIHLPEVSSGNEPAAAFSVLGRFDGVACINTSPGMMSGTHPYYVNVVLPDERCFLHEESGSNPVQRDQPTRQAPRLDILECRRLALELGGIEHVIITGGKAFVGIPKEVEEQWKKYSSTL